MKKYILFLFTLINSFGFSQKKIMIDHPVCGWDKDVIFKDSILAYDPNNQILEEVKRICTAALIPPNFQILESDYVEIALSTSDIKNNRVIFYNQSFFQSQKKEAYKIAVLAHEIGHHLNNHIFSVDQRRPSDELDADFFAGGILERLNLKLEDADSLLIEQCPIQGMGNYPARSSRIEAFAAGFNQAGTSGMLIKLSNPFDYRMKNVQRNLVGNSSYNENELAEYAESGQTYFLNLERSGKEIPVENYDLEISIFKIHNLEFGVELFWEIPSNSSSDISGKTIKFINLKEGGRKKWVMFVGTQLGSENSIIESYDLSYFESPFSTSGGFKITIRRYNGNYYIFTNERGIALISKSRFSTPYKNKIGMIKITNPASNYKPLSYSPVHLYELK